MLVIPAIDLLAGGSVRLVQGRYDRVLSYGADPLDLAERYRALGAPWLHVIDLEGARAGHWVNLARISEIAAAAGVPVQAGGGARDRQGVEAALSHGVQRVIISTAALADGHLLEALVRDFQDAIVVSLDVRHGRLLARGWLADTGQELVARMDARGNHAVRHLRGLRFSGGTTGTLVGALLVVPGRDRPVGTVSSAGRATGSDTDAEGMVGLALVHRSVGPGTVVQVGGTGTSAEVVELPAP